MAWLDEAIESLTVRPVGGYGRDERPAVEPTALTALALMDAGRTVAAAEALDWLVSVQSGDGSLGIDQQTREPCWTTGWATWAWNTAATVVPAAKAQWAAAARRATTWILNVSGLPVERGDAAQLFVGHDTTLQGWPWVVGTHSWVEPTAISLFGLRSAGQADHPRSREAVKLLLDRQLPAGGWNYGNTTVLGHVLRPHVQPTGLTLATLAAEKDIRHRVHASIGWLEKTLTERTATASLCYGLMGLSSHGVRLPAANEWLSAAYRRTLARGGPPYHVALLVLAAGLVGRTS